MTDRQGIEIDYCPQCRGVWFDRGELDKLIERAAPPPADPRGHRPDYRHEHRYREYDSRRHKKKSILKELFDF